MGGAYIIQRVQIHIHSLLHSSPGGPGEGRGVPLHLLPAFLSGLLLIMAGYYTLTSHLIEMSLKPSQKEHQTALPKLRMGGQILKNHYFGKITGFTISGDLYY